METYTLNEQNQAILDSETSSLAIPASINCLAESYVLRTLTFDAGAGHTAVLRNEFGTRLMDTAEVDNCGSLLALARENIEMTGEIPEELRRAIYLGGLRVATLDHARQWGIAELGDGIRTSAAPGRDGERTVSFVVQVTDGAALRQFRDRLNSVLLPSSVR
jgi:hypothetical protein